MLVNSNKKKCCCGCTYFAAVKSSPGSGESLFSAALGTTITVLSGSWDIDGGGRLRVTGTGMILLETPQPASEAKQSIQFASDYNSGTLTGDDTRFVSLYLDYVDANNHHVAVGKANDGPPETTSHIAKVSGGSATQLTASGSGPFFYSFTLPRLVSGYMCFQSTSVSAAGPLQTAVGLKPATTPVGGYKAAIKVEQASGSTFTFDAISLGKLSDPQCPVPENYCGVCMTLPGCVSIPAAGFLVTITGVASGDTSSTPYCTTGYGNFNGSFTCDIPYFRGWRSAWFELSPALACRVPGFDIEYTHGRVYIEPTGYDGSTFYEGPCGTKFNLWLQATSFPESDNPIFQETLNEIEPTTASSNEVGWLCELISGATFSGGGTVRQLDTTGIEYTVDAI